MKRIIVAIVTLAALMGPAVADAFARSSWG